MKFSSDFQIFLPEYIRSWFEGIHQKGRLLVDNTKYLWLSRRRHFHWSVDKRALSSISNECPVIIIIDGGGPLFSKSGLA